MSGFFPVMMFGLPAACLAMYRTAPPERRQAVGGMLLSMALTSFLTGVTEPIEFTFMFLAPVLYAVHAVLTGLAMVLMDALGVQLGFGFSAGLFDYVLNFDTATRPLAAAAGRRSPISRSITSCSAGASVRFDLRTPGREPDERRRAADAGDAGGRRAAGSPRSAAPPTCARVDACTTRLRLEVADRRDRRGARCKPLGARGVVRLGEAPCRWCSARSPTRSPARSARPARGAPAASRAVAGPAEAAGIRCRAAAARRRSRAAWSEIRRRCWRGRGKSNISSAEPAPHAGGGSTRRGGGERDRLKASGFRRRSASPTAPGT